MSQVEFMLLAALPFVALALVTWRLVWPKWKLAGKPAVYFGVAWALWPLGEWSLLLLYAHQFLGLGVHIWFCRRHGFTWWRVKDPEAYVAASKQWVESTQSRGPSSAA